MSYPDKEYYGTKLKVLLSDGGFQLVDTTSLDGYKAYHSIWIWHMCDEYERYMVKAKTTPIGLMSNTEIARQRCKYCDLRIPDGMIGQFKMMNWEYIDEIMELEKEFGNG